MRRTVDNWTPWGAWRTIFVLAMMVSLMAGGLRQTAAQDANGEPLRVVATYSILGDLVQNVAGDLIALDVLVGAGGDAHVFEPTPQDAIIIADADLIFENGLEFETWLDSVYDASDSTAQRVVVTDGLSLLSATEGHVHDHADEDHDHDHDHADEDHDHADGEDHDHADDDHDHDHGDDDHGHAHGEFDPHVWHDVNNATLMVQAIRDTLVDIDPANAVIYRSNAASYLGELAELDAWVFGEVERIPEGKRMLVTDHDTFQYFANRYGFEVIGTALGSVTTDVADPAAADIAALVDEIQATGVSAIFAENISDPQLMERLADEAGVSIAILYTDSLSEADGPASTYLDLIRYNVTTIVEALGAE